MGFRTAGCCTVSTGQGTSYKGSQCLSLWGQAVQGEKTISNHSTVNTA